MINKRNSVNFLKKTIVTLLAMIALDFAFDNILGVFKGQPLGFSMSSSQFIIFAILSALLSYFELRKQIRKETEA